MANIKTDILDYEKFIEERPDMASFDEATITSSIYSTATLLDSECFGLILKVWYETDPLSPNFRTEWELSQIYEAFVSQTQYFVNLGNDYGQGSESFSMGGINYSNQRPLERDKIAPGVLKLLTNARVYQLQSFLTNGVQNITPYDEQQHIQEWMDKRYLRIQQPLATDGQIPYVDINKQIDFGNPEDLDISVYKATYIKDWVYNDFVKIDGITNQLFIGDDLTGVNSGMTRKQINANIRFAVNASWEAQGLTWQVDFLYQEGQRTTKIIGSGATAVEKIWYSLQDDNIGNDPETSPEFWQEIIASQVPIGEIIEMLKPFVSLEIARQLDTYDTVAVYTQEQMDEILLEYAKNNNVVDLTTDQVISGIKTFNDAINMNFRKITKLADGIFDTDATNLRQVEELIATTASGITKIVQPAISGVFQPIPEGYDRYDLISANQNILKGWLEHSQEGNNSIRFINLIEGQVILDISATIVWYLFPKTEAAKKETIERLRLLKLKEGKNG